MKEMDLLRKNFQGQLEGTTNEIAQLKSTLEQLNIKREQLKGAIYALDALAGNLAAAKSAEPSALQAEEKKEQTEAKAEEAVEKVEETKEEAKEEVKEASDGQESA